MSLDEMARARTPGQDRSMSSHPDTPCGLLGLTDPATSDSLPQTRRPLPKPDGHNYPYLLQVARSVYLFRSEVERRSFCVPGMTAMTRPPPHL